MNVKCFDGKFYIYYHDDLRDRGLNDTSRAYNHWISYGSKSGRIARFTGDMPNISIKDIPDKIDCDKINQYLLDNKIEHSYFFISYRSGFKIAATNKVDSDLNIKIEEIDSNVNDIDLSEIETHEININPKQLGYDLYAEQTFIPSVEYKGEYEGYIYKNDSRGIGYYVKQDDCIDDIEQKVDFLNYVNNMDKSSFKNEKEYDDLKASIIDELSDYYFEYKNNITKNESNDIAYKEDEEDIEDIETEEDEEDEEDIDENIIVTNVKLVSATNSGI